MTRPIENPSQEFLRLYGEEAWYDWQRLTAHFDLGEGFSFLILLLPGAIGAGICRRQLADRLAARGKRLAVLPCDWRDDARKLATRLFDLEVTSDLGGVWVGTVIPESDPEIKSWREAWQYGLAALNERRNPLLRQFPCPLVLVGAPWLHSVLRETAPDLWSVRTGVVTVTPSSEPTSFADSQIQPRLSQTVTGESAADPDYALEQAERLRDRPGMEAVRAQLLLRAGNGFHNRVRYESAERCLREAAVVFAGLSTTSAEFQTDWATSLNNLSVTLSDLGRREEALEKASEALRIREQLAKARPDAFLPDLATSLNNLSVTLSDLGRREEALEKASEAVRIYEQLAKARPDVFLPDLAASLNTLANMLSELGRREEALGKASEAVRIYEQLAKARPDAFLPYLATSLNNLANMLSNLGRREEALVKAEDAVRIYEQLVKVRPDAFLPNLAMSCGARGKIYSGMRRHTDAIASFAQGIAALTSLFEKTPTAFANLIGALRQNYLEALQQTGEPPDMALLAPVEKPLRQS